MSRGCERCEEEILKQNVGLKALGDMKSAFTATASYFSCSVYQCPECGSHWADVFHEWDDESTMYEEWGHVERFVRLLSDGQLKAIQEAQGKHSLDYESFFDYRSTKKRGQDQADPDSARE